MFSICIAGGASSGKKAVCELIIQRLKDGLVDHSSKVAVIKLEDFYRDLTGEERKLLDQGLYNFDHPNALDFDLLHSVLESLSQGTPCILPKWDFQLFKRIPSSTELSSPDVCIVVGNLALYSKPIRESFHLKVFVDVDSDLRLAKQVLRDTEERYQLPLDKVLDDYLNFVKPAFEDFILPTKKHANVIIPRGSENKVAIGLLATHIVDILKGNQDTNESSTAFPQGVHQTMRVQ